MTTDSLRQCVHCHDLYGAEEISHNLRNRKCVCVGCNDTAEMAEEARQERSESKAESPNDLIVTYGRAG